MEPAADTEVVPKPAGLLAHRHDHHLSGLYNALVRGDLRPAGEGRWLIVPTKVVEPSGSGSPRDLVRTLRSARRATSAYLGRRGLPPKVDRPTLKTLTVASASRSASPTAGVCARGGTA